MNITFFLRANSESVSIGKAFRPLIEEIGKNASVELYYMPSANYGIKGVIQNLLFTYRHRNRNGINHVTGECHFIILALLGCKSVLTIHDLGFYTKHLHEMSFVKRKLLYYLQIYLPIKMSTRVVAISQKTKDEILGVINFQKDIYIAKHVSIDAFPYTPKMLGNPVRILQCGTRPNKNLETTIKALSGSNYELRVIRKMTESQIKLAHDCNVKFSNVSNLTDEEMTREYQESDIVVMPSLYEGFGAMIIEAQATGRPVITTKLEPMITVSGEGSCLLNNPQNEQELKEAIDKIVLDNEYRNMLVKKGRMNASNYTLEKCAQEYFIIYKSICHA